MAETVLGVVRAVTPEALDRQMQLLTTACEPSSLFFINISGLSYQDAVGQIVSIINKHQIHRAVIKHLTLFATEMEKLVQFIQVINESGANLYVIDGLNLIHIDRKLLDTLTMLSDEEILTIFSEQNISFVADYLNTKVTTGTVITYLSQISSGLIGLDPGNLNHNILSKIFKEQLF